jgi:Zn-dependent protease with chaperone function
MQNSIKHLAIIMVGVLSLLPISVVLACGLMSVINSLLLYVISTVGIFSILKKTLLNSDLDFNHDPLFKKLSSTNPIHCEIKDVVDVLSQLSHIKLPNIYIKNRQGDLPQIGIECVTHPDYTIIISEDLVSRYKQGISRTQLSLLISHELGHFFYRDHLWAAFIILGQSTYALQSVMAIGLTLVFAPAYILIMIGSLTFGFGLQSLLSRLHSRFCEYTADGFAAELCQSPDEMKCLFENIAREYQHWGMAMHQNNFAEYKLYSDYQLAPLLEWHHYLASKKDLDEKQRQDLFVLKQNLLHYYPFNINQDKPDITQYLLTWLNSYPTSKERKNQFK